MIISAGSFAFIFGPHRASLFILDAPHTCDGCHRSMRLFVARPGDGALCLVCDNPRRERADYDAWLLDSVLPKAQSLTPKAPPTKEAQCSAPLAAAR